MKKQFFGDQRDYLKYSIIRHLLEQDITCTVCWMLTPDNCSGEGGVRGFLNDPDKYRGYDHAVFDYLKEQTLADCPDIHSMERAGPIADCRFYWKCFPLDASMRAQYFAGCLEMAKGTDLVFLDPDVGPEPRRRTKGWEEYVKWNEISPILDAGHSVLLFNSLPRGETQKRTLIEERTKRLNELVPKPLHMTVLRTNDLAFYLAVQQNHRDPVDRAIDCIIDDWRDFKLWEVE